jgi:ABC-2 type transport system permease protein
VRLGRFDQLLLRPLSLTLQVFGSSFDLKRLGRIAVGLGIFAYALSAGDIAWTVAKLAYLPVVVLGMVLFFGGLFLLGDEGSGPMLELPDADALHGVSLWLPV